MLLQQQSGRKKEGRGWRNFFSQNRFASEFLDSALMFTYGICTKLSSCF